MIKPEQLIDILEGLSPLADLPRTGWVLRGVVGPESVAAHSYAVALTAMMIVDRMRSRGQAVDGERVLRMALLHDAAEARTGDMPMPNKTPELRGVLERHEHNLVKEMLTPLQVELWLECERGKTLESQVVKAADKLQMMVQVMMYQRQGRGQLHEFVTNEKNREDQGLDFVRACYEDLWKRAGWDGE